MATILHFEDLECWKKARILANAVYDVNEKLAVVHDYSLRDQLRRSFISVMANIAEGFERGGAREFINFLAIARGSLAETKPHLYLGFDRGYITGEKLKELIALADEIVRQISALMGYLQKTGYSGTKFASQTNRKPLAAESLSNSNRKP
jgi:four helix bundle protein